MIEKYSPTRIWFYFSSSLRNLTPSEANLSASHQSTGVLSPLEITKGDLKRRGSLSPLTMHLVPGSTLETLWVGKKKKKKHKNLESKPFQSSCLLSHPSESPASNSAAGMCFHRKPCMPYLPSEKNLLLLKRSILPTNSVVHLS